MGIAMLAVAAISGAASVCALGNRGIVLGLAGIGFAVGMLVAGVHFLKSEPSLTVSNAGLGVGGYWLTNNNWNLPWSSVGHAQVVTTIVGSNRGRILYLYPSREVPRPLKAIGQVDFDNFEEIVKLVGEQMAKAGHPLEEIEKTMTPPA